MWPPFEKRGTKLWAFLGTKKLPIGICQKVQNITGEASKALTLGSPPSPHPKPPRYEPMMEHAAAASAIAAAKAGLQAKATLRGLLQSTLRVTLSDGRVVTGQYQCLDEHLNFILQGATERRVVRERAGVEESVERQQVRNLGLVVLPGKHVVKVEVKEGGRDPLELPRVKGTTKMT